ncbi:MAG TPA: hypothetical protein VF062_17535 [Candidatus Limnocylindrales bacterium]
MEQGASAVIEVGAHGKSIEAHGFTSNGDGVGVGVGGTVSGSMSWRR